eukprot:Selendium_serpulae@DN10301_c0_g1_i1.p2
MSVCGYVSRRKRSFAEFSFASDKCGLGCVEAARVKRRRVEEYAAEAAQPVDGPPREPRAKRQRRTARPSVSRDSALPSERGDATAKREIEFAVEPGYEADAEASDEEDGPAEDKGPRPAGEAIREMIAELL